MTDTPEAVAVERVRRFAKSTQTTPEEHDDIMVAVRLARAMLSSTNAGEVGLACPWCSGTEIVVHPLPEPGLNGLRNNAPYYGHCDGCGADGPCGDTEAEAERLWKTRAALAAKPLNAGEGEITHAERVEYEERILAAEMRAVALTRALRPFAAKADKWAANHPGRHNLATGRVQHRFGDFAAARDTIASHGIFSGDES